MPEQSGDNRVSDSSSGQSLPPKYFVGNEIVDWRKNGRRMTRSPSRDWLQVGGVFCSPRARSSANVNEPHSSSGGSAASSGLSRAMPVAAKGSFEGQVHCFGEKSVPPSTLLKDQAF